MHFPQTIAGGANSEGREVLPQPRLLKPGSQGVCTWTGCATGDGSFLWLCHLLCVCVCTCRASWLCLIHCLPRQPPRQAGPWGSTTVLQSYGRDQSWPYRRIHKVPSQRTSSICHHPNQATSGSGQTMKSSFFLALVVTIFNRVEWPGRPWGKVTRAANTKPRY